MPICINFALEGRAFVVHPAGFEIFPGRGTLAIEQPAIATMRTALASVLTSGLRCSALENVAVVCMGFVTDEEAGREPEQENEPGEILEKSQHVCIASIFTRASSSTATAAGIVA
jgi:hypothetical protein